MAKKYIRINFEDRPSTRSPIDATNLNKIDAAVDELDTWRDSLIVDNVASTLTDKALSAKQGKLLNDKVTTLNESFQRLSIDIEQYPTLLSFFNSMKIGTYAECISYTKKNDYPINENGGWNFKISKPYDKEFGYITAYYGNNDGINQRMWLGKVTITNVIAWDEVITQTLQPQKIDWLDTITLSGTYYIKVSANNKHHFPSGNQIDDAYNIQAIVYGDNAALFCGQIGYSRFFYNTLTISTKTLGTPRVLE